MDAKLKLKQAEIAAMLVQAQGRKDMSIEAVIIDFQKALKAVKESTKHEF